MMGYESVAVVVFFFDFEREVRYKWQAETRRGPFISWECVVNFSAVVRFGGAKT